MLPYPMKSHDTFIDTFIDTCSQTAPRGNLCSKIFSHSHSHLQSIRHLFIYFITTSRKDETKQIAYSACWKSCFVIFKCWFSIFIIIYFCLSRLGPGKSCSIKEMEGYQQWRCEDFPGTSDCDGSSQKIFNRKLLEQFICSENTIFWEIHVPQHISKHSV